MQLNVNGLQVETFHVPTGHAYNRDLFPGEGWYWWCCMPGCLPDSDPYGPFDGEFDAYKDALEMLGAEAA